MTFRKTICLQLRACAISQTTNMLGFLESRRLLFSGFLWYLNSFVYYMNRLLRQDFCLLVEWLNRLWRKREAESWYNGYDISYIRGFRCAPTCL